MPPGDGAGRRNRGTDRRLGEGLLDAIVGGHELVAQFTGGLTDNLAGKLTATVRQRDGYGENVITPEELSAGESAADDTSREKPKFPIATVAVATLGILFFVVGRFAKIASPVRFGVLLAAAIGAFFLRPQATSDPRSLSSITEDQAVEKFERLQANMYSAFDYEEEEQVYDVLAQSVDGALLDDIYAEVYQSLLVVDKSSAVCKVHEVEVLESRATAVDPSSDGRAQRFDIACHWRVHGVVKHFEHIHRRVNEYRADYRLTKKPEGWKITGVAVSEQDRLDPRTLKPSEDY